MGLIDGLRGRLSSTAPTQSTPNATSAATSADRGSAEAVSRLQRRRDELAAQVGELHWDLGGLAYEMAIRDHFRLDVLVRRAAVLQERDAELAELERLLRLEEGASASDCPRCGAPHSRGALFCWQCGTQLMARTENVAPEAVSPPGRPLPGPGVAATLVLLMLGFGVLSGTVARGNAGTTPAHRGRLTVMLAAAGPASTAPSTPLTLGSTPPPPGPAEATATPSAPSESASTPSVSAGDHAGASPESTSPAHTTPKPAPAAKTPKSVLPPVKHVFLIVLADQPYAATFGPGSAAPYLSGTLEKQGELLVRYYGVARDELANEIALISGQGPTPATAVNCPTFQDLSPASAGADAQYSGNGCVYPKAAQTVGDQLLAKQLTWRVYAEDMENATAPEPKACRHPALGSADPTAQPRPGDAFASYRDPFSYFHSAIDSRACAGEDTGLGALRADLKQAKRTPALSYIVPNLCDDGRAAACAPGRQAGLPAADAFLRRVIPEIMASPAYKQGGLLVITTDQAPTAGAYADSSSCCSQPAFPGIPGNQPTRSGPGAAQLPPPGGGQVGALLLSPYVKAHTVDQEPFNHFSLLRTIEDLFGLSHLGYAEASGASSFGPTVFSAYQGG